MCEYVRLHGLYDERRYLIWQDMMMILLTFLHLMM